ncbi:hypothetical protein [Rhizobium sullae]|uniref:hypothetical protein n=1 Tax=Rhizobium sullae TaxID=50338 RepID=UPI00104FBEA4|nr:hypothetical protein [Rhizobium sullae]
MVAKIEFDSPDEGRLRVRNEAVIFERMYDRVQGYDHPPEFRQIACAPILAITFVEVSFAPSSLTIVKNVGSISPLFVIALPARTEP